MQKKNFIFAGEDHVFFVTRKAESFQILRVYQ